MINRFIFRAGSFQLRVVFLFSVTKGHIIMIKLKQKQLNTSAILYITILLLAVGFFSHSSNAKAKVSGGIKPSLGKHTLTTNSCSFRDRHSFDDYKRWTKNLFRNYKIPRKAKIRHAHYLRCPSGPNHRLAMKKRWKRIKKSLLKRLPANHDTWVRIGRCEQPGSGYAGINWSHPGPTYQGGLGIWHGNWSSLKPKGFPSSAGQATWRQQMLVANRLAARYGFSAWGCY